MLTELDLNEDGKTRINLVDGTTMSVITPQRRRAVDEQLVNPMEYLMIQLGVLPETYADPMPIPDHLVEVCFVHPDRPEHLPEVLVPEWQDNLKDPAFSGTWTIYHVTEQQVLDYANKVGVK